MASHMMTAMMAQAPQARNRGRKALVNRAGSCDARADSSVLIVTEFSTACSRSLPVSLLLVERSGAMCRSLHQRRCSGIDGEAFDLGPAGQDAQILADRPLPGPARQMLDHQWRCAL